MDWSINLHNRKSSTVTHGSLINSGTLGKDYYLEVCTLSSVGRATRLFILYQTIPTPAAIFRASCNPLRKTQGVDFENRVTESSFGIS